VTTDSVSSWIRKLEKGDQTAAYRLWDRYGEALQRIARSKFGPALNATFDEQDLAQSVFMALWKNAESGRLEQIKDRHELWWLLLEITRRRALSRMEYNQAAKRLPESGNAKSASSSSGDIDPLANIADPRELSPEVISILTEEHERFMSLLRDDTMRSIARLHLEDFSLEEIAIRVDVSVRTITRKLKIIRDIWAKELESQDH